MVEVGFNGSSWSN